MSQRIVLLTGVTGSIGNEIARGVLQQPNIHLVLAVRNVTAAEKVVEKLKQETQTNNSISIEQLHLDSKKSIQEFTTLFKSKYPKLVSSISNEMKHTIHSALSLAFKCEHLYCLYCICRIFLLTMLQHTVTHVN